MTHSECVGKLKETGEWLGFEAIGKGRGKMYELANPDCVWYYKGRGREELYKIAKGDKYKHLPFVAFEVAYSEKEKNLRGSLVSLLLTNASASIFVVLGKTATKDLKSKLNKLIGRYSFARFRVWTAKDVEQLYKTVKKKYSRA